MTAASDRDTIREVVENWVVWRDAGDWERFRGVWHDDGRMMATWFQGSGRGVHRRQPRRLRQGRQHPALPRRQLGRRRRQPRHLADQDDDLAARHSCTTCSVDVVCTGRFYDFFEKRDGALGRSCCASRSTRRTAWTRSIPRHALTLDADAARTLPRGLSPPRLSADRDRLQGEARHARPQGAGGRGALRARPRLAGGQAAAGLKRRSIEGRATKFGEAVAGIWRESHPRVVSLSTCQIYPT